MENKRDFFRLDLFGLEPVWIEDDRDKYKGKISNISGAGMLIYFDYEVPAFKQGYVAKARFALEGVEFQFFVQILRKKPIDKEIQFAYACTFHEVSERDKEKISSLLLRIDAKRRLN